MTYTCVYRDEYGMLQREEGCTEERATELKARYRDFTEVLLATVAEGNVMNAGRVA